MTPTKFIALPLLLGTLAACASAPPPLPVAKAAVYQAPAKSHVVKHKPTQTAAHHPTGADKANATVADASASPHGPSQAPDSEIPIAGE